MIRDLGPWPPCWLLYPFRFVDPVSGKWTRARYVATIKEIEARYARWEIVGPAERRAKGGAWQSFNPAA